MTSLTAANAVITLTVDGVFSTPQQLQQFSVDDVADVDTLTVAETLMGVDGYLSGGYVFNKVKYVYTLQADSPSCFFFDQWKLAQDSQEDTYPANGQLLLKSLGTKWTWTRGFLTEWMPAPNVKKILQPRKFSIEWESVVPQPSS
jgi:hypothetical protein